VKLLIVADPHANWPALRAVAEQERDADEIVSLGDLLINGPLPAECVRWTRDRCRWSIVGNHDRRVIDAADGLGKTSGSRARELAVRHAAALDEGELEYLRNLPLLARFGFGGATFTAVHGSMTDPLLGGIYEETPALEVRAQLDLARTDFLLCGHTHRPLVRTYRGMTVVNPGAVGQPRDDDPRAQYAVWLDGRIELRRAAYEVEETVRAMQVSGCPEQYLDGLIVSWRNGWNPSALPGENG
jgi:putative phosphoesterase